MVDESKPQESSAPKEVAPGIRAAYDLPDERSDISEPTAEVDSGESLEELMAKMQSI